MSIDRKECDEAWAAVRQRDENINITVKNLRDQRDLAHELLREVQECLSDDYSDLLKRIALALRH
jgi:hypothetical protein